MDTPFLTTIPRHFDFTVGLKKTNFRWVKTSNGSERDPKFSAPGASAPAAPFSSALSLSANAQICRPNYYIAFSQNADANQATFLMDLVLLMTILIVMSNFHQSVARLQAGVLGPSDAVVNETGVPHDYDRW